MKIHSFFKVALSVGFCLLSSFSQAETESLTSIPRDLGLPVVVNTSINFLEVKSINENEGNFDAIVDTRLIWVDHRLAYNKALAPRGFIDYRDDEATKRLSEIWRPFAYYKNRIGDPISEVKDLRIYPDGTVNYLRRIEAKFASDFDLTSFPYDQQQLAVHLISRTEPSNRVVFVYTDKDLSFSNSSKTSKIDGWDVGNVSLERSVEEGLRGTKYPELTASLKITRQPFGATSTIIVPLFCCLLIPLLVVWLNTLNSEEHEGFGMSNTEIACFPMTGIFAVVALQFTVNGSYSSLGQSDNLVMRLFALNYVMLGFSFFVSVLLYRFYVLKRLFGRFVQDEFFVYLCWAAPALCFGVAWAIIAIA